MPTPPPKQPAPNNGPDRRGPAAGGRVSAADAIWAAERLTYLAHELGNVLDGSLRTLGLARSALAEWVARDGDGSLTRALGQVETVYVGLERMCDLMHNAMSGAPSMIGSSTLARGRPVSVADAARHAAEVLGQSARERGVLVRIGLHPALDAVPAGPLYSLLVNAIQNATDSIVAARREGAVEVECGILELGNPVRPWVRVEVRDNGTGLPTNIAPARLFDVGVTTKPGSGGIGLGLCRQIIEELGGSIEIAPRRTPDGVPAAGAVLRAVYPAPVPVAHPPQTPQAPRTPQGPSPRPNA